MTCIPHRHVVYEYCTAGLKSIAHDEFVKNKTRLCTRTRIFTTNEIFIHFKKSNQENSNKIGNKVEANLNTY